MKNSKTCNITSDRFAVTDRSISVHHRQVSYMMSAKNTAGNTQRSNYHT